MGYYQVTLVVDGAVEEETTVPSDTALNKYALRVATEITSSPWQIFSVWHEHAEGLECECIQYVQNHHPYSEGNVE